VGCIDHEHGDTVVREREATRNYLVIELKKSTSGAPRDTGLQKLRGYKRELGYEHALFIELSCGERADVASAEWATPARPRTSPP